MTKILVFRFSAMGDVVMLLPVLKGVLTSNANIEIFLVTQKSFFSFFSGIERLTLVEVDLKGLRGSPAKLYKLYKSLQCSVQPHIVVDMHRVIRTSILSFFFRLSGVKVFNFRKGSIQKRRYIRFKHSAIFPTTIERYLEVFTRMGFRASLPSPPLFESEFESERFSELFAADLLIGIAPFAKHRQKIWGVNKIEELIERINNSFDADILLFGGGAEETATLEQIASKFPNCLISAKHFNLSSEIKVIQRMSVMVSMDSANMHIAAMAGIPVVSIWGATHPVLGFSPYNQPQENIIQYDGDRLSCRPCSVYGSKKCKYGEDIRCMNYVSVDTVFDRVTQILRNRPEETKL